MSTIIKYAFYLFQFIFILCFLGVAAWFFYRKLDPKYKTKVVKWSKYGFFAFQFVFVVCVFLILMKGCNRLSGPILSRIPAAPKSGENIICSFESDKEKNMFEFGGGSSGEISDNFATKGKSSLKLFIDGTGDYPGMIWEVYERKHMRDWRGYKYLAVDLYNESDQAVAMTCKLKGASGGSGEDHIQIAPAEKMTWEIDISSKGIYLNEISYIKIFVESPKREYVIYFDNLRVTNGQGNNESGEAAEAENDDAGSDKMLFDFEDEKYKEFFAVNGGLFAEISAEAYSNGKHALFLEFPKGADLPGLVWEVFNSRYCLDWSPYQFLAMDLFNSGSSTVDLNLKIKSAPNYPKKTYEQIFVLEAGTKKTMFFELSKIEGAGLDLKTISYINLFNPNPGASGQIFLDAMRLIKNSPQSSSWTQVAKVEPKPAPAGAAAVTPETQEPTAIKTGTADFQLKAAHNLAKIRREPENLPGALDTTLRISLAKNEHEDGQIIVSGQAENLQAVTVDISDLKSADNQVFSKENIAYNFIGYVQTVQPYYRADYVGLWPDPLLEQRTLDIPRGVVQPIWISLYCPETTSPGTYKGVISIHGGNTLIKEIPIEVEVWDFLLPKTSSLKTAFDFYDYFIPTYYTRQKGEELSVWESRVQTIKETYYKNMYEHKISPVFNIDPNKSDFPERMKRYKEWGMSAFAIGRNGGSFGNHWVSMQEIIPTYSKYAQALKGAGLSDMAYIYAYDEPGYGDQKVSELCAAIHEASPDLNNMVCIRNEFSPSKQPEWGKDIDIWCVHVSRFDEKEAQYVKKQGKEVWMYISGPDETYPGIAIDLSLVKTRIIPWACWKYDVTGLLYWCVNFWEKDPWKTTEATPWKQNGNATLYYPGTNGPVETVRLAAMRDGIEDYEYLTILENKIRQVVSEGKGLEKKTTIDQGRALLNVDKPVMKNLTDYTNSPENLFEYRKAVAAAIVQLGK